MAAWFQFALGYRISRAATLWQIDLAKLERELKAKGTCCEVQECTDQAVTVLMDGVAGFLCMSHFARSRSGIEGFNEIVRSILTVKNRWLEGQKVIYSEWLNSATGLQQLVVEKQPGVPIMETAIEKSSPLPKLEMEIMLMPLLPFNL